MGFAAIDMVNIIEVMEGYLLKHRPPEEIRAKLDTGYRIEKQSIILFQTRPQWNKPGEYHDYDFAKATYTKSKD